MIIYFIIVLGFLSSILAGCGGGLTPRLPDLVGQDTRSSGELRTENTEWVQASKIGLVVHSDASAPDAAPPILPVYLDTLTRRAQKFLGEHCPFQEIVVMPPLATSNNLSSSLQDQGRRFQVPSVMVVVLSGREKAAPTKLGEATMMTQMSGTVRENSALAEIGVFTVQNFNMVYMTSSQATDTLEELDAPLGLNRPSASEAHDILRAQAAQQALDRALEPVKSACRHARER